MPAVDATANGGKVRVTLKAHPSSGPMSLQNVSIGIRSGSTSAVTVTPTPILFSGNAATGVVAQNTTITSDWTTFTFDKTKDHFIIADYVQSGSYGHARNTSTNAKYLYYYRVDSTYNDLDFASTPTTAGSEQGMVTKLEVKDGTTSTTADQTLVSLSLIHI